jgi:uncharacterized protein (TIGR00255 family)
MIKSMTGYGRAEAQIRSRKYTVEIRSLNSKQFDLNLRMPSVYKEKEMELRSSMSRTLVRGKIDVTIYYEALSDEKKVSVNKPLMTSYYNDLKELADSVGIEKADYISALLRIPDVLKPEREELDENEWNELRAIIDKAVHSLDDYRTVEGSKLEQEFHDRISSIGQLAVDMEGPLKQRMVKIREKIRNNLDELIDPEKVDKNRFEQELIYYMEKLDITEEQQRLKSNCDYFEEILGGDTSDGKKLGFISQEVGREINTMGSKANDSEVQRIVVKMKDELEKIKEQVLNAL